MPHSTGRWLFGFLDSLIRTEIFIFCRFSGKNETKQETEKETSKLEEEASKQVIVASIDQVGDDHTCQIPTPRVIRVRPVDCDCEGACSLNH